jgi:hypothetical protein
MICFVPNFRHELHELTRIQFVKIRAIRVKKICVQSVFHLWLKISYPIRIHTVFKYAGSARLMGKSGGCGT